ncbi:MAG: FixH family protein [Gammaproteobacteria bacterium]
MTQPVTVKWYREPYIWLLISLPLSAVIGGIITLWLALESDDGLVVDDYYKRGLEINRTLERDRLASRYELSARLQMAGQSGRPFRIVLKSNESFTPPGRIEVSFLHATRKGYDKHLLMDRVNDNAYQGRQPELVRGKWYVLIEADDWRLIKKVVI